MAKISIKELILEVFDSNALREALVEEIERRISYEDLAEKLLDDMFDNLNEFAAELALEEIDP